MKRAYMGFVLLALLLAHQVAAFAAPAQNLPPSLNNRVYLAMLTRPVSPPPAPTSTPAPAPVSYENQVVQLINQRRAAAGCQPLFVNPQLTSAAELHSQDMATNNFFSHTGSNGLTPQHRVQQAGYPALFYGGENIAAGQPTPTYVVDAWMNSAGHRANILNCTFKTVGTGYVYDAGDTFGPYRHYWTQVFGLQ